MNGWIVAYILRTKGTQGENIDTDHYEVFIDDGEKTITKANKRFADLCNGGKFNSAKVEVYFVNLCKIINSTEATYLDIPR